MSRTFVIPVLDELTGLVTDTLPPDLSFNQLPDNEVLTPAQRRIYFPYSLDPLAGITYQENQKIYDLGLIDPVDLYSSVGSQNNAPDDFLATISVRSLSQDDTGDALITVVDSVFNPRFPSFQLPLPGPVAPTPQRVSTRYGIPLFSGDMIIVDWLNFPALSGAALITLNLSPADGCCMQQATAAWFQVSGEGPVQPGCVPPEITVVDSFPAPIYGGGVGPPTAYQLVIVGDLFEPTDLVQIGDVNGVSVIGLPLYIGPNEWQLPIEVDSNADIGPLSVAVVRAEDSGCFGTGSIDIIPFP